MMDPGFETPMDRLAAEYAAWAAAQGLRYAFRLTVPVVDWWSQSIGGHNGQPMLSQVHVFDGDHDGLRVRMHQVNEHSGVRAVPHAHVVTLELPMACPLLQVGFEGSLAGLWRLLGMGDLTFGHDGFDRRFRVGTDDERFARQVLTVDTMTWLMEHPFMAAGVFHVKERWLVVTLPGALGPAAGLASKLAFAHQLRSRIPTGHWTADT